MRAASVRPPSVRSPLSARSTILLAICRRVSCCSLPLARILQARSRATSMLARVLVSKLSAIVIAVFPATCFWRGMRSIKLSRLRRPPPFCKKQSLQIRRVSENARSLHCFGSLRARFHVARLLQCDQRLGLKINFGGRVFLLSRHENQRKVTGRKIARASLKIATVAGYAAYTAPPAAQP